MFTRVCEIHGEHLKVMGLTTQMKYGTLLKL